jgi:hypothetical protein
MNRALTWFANGWIALVLTLNAIDIIGIMMTAPSIWAGISAIRDAFNPFNLIHFAFEAALCAPAIGALMWRDSRRKRLSA